MLSSASAAPASSEDRYIATRDAAIEKISKLYDDSKGDEATKAEEAATADLLAQLKVILAEGDRQGFGPAKPNIGSYYEGDEDFGTLDGLRFESLLGENGQKAGSTGKNDKYIEPKSQIVVTTGTMFERWLRAHKEIPQATTKALGDESAYTRAISNGSAVVKFASLPIAKPSGATFAYAMLAARTQSEMPDASGEVIVAAIANGEVYVAEGSITPKVRVAACVAQKKAKPEDDEAYARCFRQRAPKEPAFRQAIAQAQALLTAALGR
ncbi:hypothetical protein [Afipia sp. GAS231]|uniref:hypothetical protein n=1 Tax=Afipia sp. GAS231 TaxID=1882747 RepID=UPI000B885594|nr:hypothetical protein [Afipia sp. GAS231]